MNDFSTSPFTVTENQENTSTDFDKRLDSAIHKSRDFLLSRQTEEGYWVDELESNATITAELIFFMHLTETVDLEKQKKVTFSDYQQAVEQMCQLNDIGSKIAKIPGVNAITDVTGFGLAGHILEVCQGSKVGATVCFNDLPLLSNIYSYIDKGCIPGGTQRNYDSYGHFFNKLTTLQNTVLCDPQTSGGL